MISEVKDVRSIPSHELGCRPCELPKLCVAGAARSLHPSSRSHAPRRSRFPWSSDHHPALAAVHAWAADGALGGGLLVREGSSPRRCLHPPPPPQHPGWRELRPRDSAAGGCATQTAGVMHAAKRGDASWVPNGSSDDPSYEEHGILGALKLRVGGLFGSAAAPAAIDSSYDQFNAASLLSQGDAVEGPPVVSPTQPQLASEPDATNASPTSTSAPGLAVQSEQTLTPPVGSPAPAAAAAAASADEAAAVAAADAQEDATVRAPSPLLASPRLAEASAAADLAPVREPSPASHTPVRAAAVATASVAIAAVNAAAATAANANPPSPQASTPRVSEVEDLALGLAPASPGAPEAAVSNDVPEQPTPPPAPTRTPQGSTPTLASTPVGAAAAATAAAAVAAAVATAASAITINKSDQVAVQRAGLNVGRERSNSRIANLD